MRARVSVCVWLSLLSGCSFAGCLSDRQQRRISDNVINTLVTLLIDSKNGFKHRSQETFAIVGKQSAAEVHVTAPYVAYCFVHITLRFPSISQVLCGDGSDDSAETKTCTRQCNATQSCFARRVVDAALLSSSVLDCYGCAKDFDTLTPLR